MADATVFYDGPIVSRAEAKAAGMKHYFTGKPCNKGHIAQRYTSSGCVVCSEAQRTAWSAANIDRHKQLQADWYKVNKEHHRAYGYAWSKANTAKRSKHSATWRAKNRQRVRDTKRIWRKNNPLGVAHHRLDEPKTRAKALRRMVNSRMKTRVRDVLLSVGVAKGGKSWLDFVPYTAEELMARLQKTMPSGYTWDDYVSGALHLDHVVPVSAFNFTSPADIDFQRCWDLKNLQLLPAAKNLSKSNKLDKPFQPAFSGI